MALIETKTLNCRICGGPNLYEAMDFGNLALTGVFQADGDQVPTAPLCLCRCQDCGLVQLRHSYQQESLYGETYGYESHLNASMVSHLQAKAKMLERKYLAGNSHPVVVDIASNDGTLLAGYTNPNSRLIGIDPLIHVVTDYYPVTATKLQEFFSASGYFSQVSEKADLVTSLSVLYDLDNPRKFAQDIAEILNDNGIWHFEQSYLPTMVDTLSYDTICHEHLLYLTLSDIQNLLAGTDMVIIDASLNSINGGSITVTAQKSSKKKKSPFVDFLLDKEEKSGYRTNEPIKRFSEKASQHKIDLKNLIQKYIASGFEVYALGASTKGNVLLQWLEIDQKMIKSVGDVNSRKFGKQTPGTCIPIVAESEILNLAKENVIAIVLPWHFRQGIVTKSQQFMQSGGALLFPLPQIEVVSI